MMIKAEVTTQVPPQATNLMEQVRSTNLHCREAKLRREEQEIVLSVLKGVQRWDYDDLM
jgi:hypothetical protein